MKIIGWNHEQMDNVGRKSIYEEIDRLNVELLEVKIERNLQQNKRLAAERLLELNSTVLAVQSVLAERQRQDNKWGQQNHEPVYWLGILGEEFGELCQATNETHFNNGPVEQQKGGIANMRAEAVQVAAVAIAFVEMLDRRSGESL